MKHTVFSIIARTCLGLCTMSVMLSICGCASKVNNATATFWVRGNCGMCEKTIETALNATEGVASADYDLGAHMLTVSYDSNAIGLEGLHHACASAGYETRLQPAVPAAYGALPKCCQKMSDQ